METRTGSRREYVAHTPLVQSENQSGKWGDVHEKRGFA
jgi:hypothetical protein